MATQADTNVLKCCLKSCEDRDKELRCQSRVEVKSLSPLCQGKYAIAWGDDGQATFHKSCWDKIQPEGNCDMNDLEILMVKEAAKTAEYFDSVNVLEQEAEKIANLLKSSKHAIAFTGAGISTSAGIGDFRGNRGIWTERNKKKKYGPAAKSSSKGRLFTYESLRPTYTHEAIAKLVELGMLKYVISQNVDGLHRLSGIPKTHLSELHGNVFHERCEKCGTRFERKFASRRVHKKGSVHSLLPCTTSKNKNRTGGICDFEACGGYLTNTIINFGDDLEIPVLNNAETHAQANDLVLCLGSSLLVYPACDLMTMGNPVRLAICNRQTTPFDEMCKENGSRVYGDCDDLMKLVMNHVLSITDLRKWEEMRAERLTTYDPERERWSNAKSESQSRKRTFRSFNVEKYPNRLEKELSDLKENALNCSLPCNNGLKRGLEPSNVGIKKLKGQLPESDSDNLNYNEQKS